MKEGGREMMREGGERGDEGGWEEVMREGGEEGDKVRKGMRKGGGR